MQKSIKDLQHGVDFLPMGGFVLMLNRGAIITAEDDAMIQAMYSRDPGSIYSHLEKLAVVGSGRFMEQFYVGYAHKSIGDCGDVTLFIEGVSMLAAKAIQDWQLYSGQEVSTRYVDFSTQPFLSSLASKPTRALGEMLRNFYVLGVPKVEDHVAMQFPKLETENDSVYKKAVKARAFDIMRGFLPAGASTSLSWHANLRQTADKLAYLRHHPLQEVRWIAESMERVLMHGAPHSFTHKRYPETEHYNKWWMENGYYFDPKGPYPDFAMPSSGILVDKTLLKEYEAVILGRPPKTELPSMINECGTIRFEMLLDFGSYRDIQRQRSVLQRMPRLTTKFGFEPWYLEQLPDDMRSFAENSLLPEVEEEIYRIKKHVFVDEENEAQYITPTGFRVPCRLTGGLASMVYIAELRSTVFVHATLQLRAKQMAEAMDKKFKLNLHVDKGEVGRFDVNRGKQDIIAK